jgi:hypothetical protein
LAIEAGARVTVALHTAEARETNGLRHAIYLC